MPLRLFFGFLVGLAWIGCPAPAPAAEDLSARPGASGHETTAKAAPAPSHGGAEKEAQAPHGKEGKEGKKKGKIDPLDFQTKLALWTGVMFLVFYVILWKFAWRPIAEGLDKRERHVADQIHQAQASNEEARRLLTDYQAKLAASEAEVRGILDQGRRDAELLGQQILQKAKADTELEKQRALREIETATSGAIKELAETTASLAVELAGKLVQAELDPKAHVRLIEQAVSGFSKMTPSKN